MSRFTICSDPQRSPAWFAARLGRATGSIASAIKAKPKTGNGEAVTRRNERVRLAIEQLTGVPQDDAFGFLSADMKRGIAHEPLAGVAYEARTGEVLRRPGFLSMRDHKAGCSLDFDVGNITGFLEAKCPNAAIQIETIEQNRVPPEHMPQITHNFWVSEAKWCDFISYNASMPKHLQLFVFRVERDEPAIKIYETEVLRFLAEVSLTVKTMREMKVAA